MKTIDTRMREAGYTSGFDYLRIGLAFAVVLWHSITTSGDMAVKGFVLGPVIGPIQALILPMFFALSGFLVAGSVERSKTITGFVTLRVIRIIPALAVEVLLSALILGPIVTTVSLGSYVSDPEFATYFWNIIGHIHFTLPGVFENNPLPDYVNFSLWTVPYELECYLALVLMVAVGLYKRPRLFLLATAGLIALATIVLIIKTGGVGQPGMIDGRILVLGFLAGVTVYLFRAVIPFSGPLALASFILSFALLSYPPTRPLSVVTAVYTTVWLGLQTPPKIMGGDYSYGVYLFAFPIQQVIASNPALATWYIIFAITIPLSLVYAAFSWHCVEKPIMMRKKGIVAAAEGFVGSLRRRREAKAG